MTEKERVASTSNSAEVELRSNKWPPSIFKLCIAGLIAGCVGFAIMKFVHPLFILPDELARVPEQAPIEVYQKHDQAQYELDGWNYAILFALAGSLLGGCCVVLCFGFKATKALVSGVVCAGVLGAVGALLSNWMFNNMGQLNGQNATLMGISMDGMTQSIVGYALLWSMIGLGAGIGVGIANGAKKATLAGVSGFIGGILASMVYVIVTAQVSIGTIMNTVVPMGDISQVLWFILFPGLVVLCIGLGSGEKRKKLSD